MSAARGLAFVVTGGQSVHLLPEPFLWLGSGRIGPLPVPVVGALTVTALAHLVLAHTRFGRGVTAVGGNEEASRLAGLNIGRLKCLVYVIAGFCVGLGAAFATARLGSGDPNRGIGAELDAIAAVIIGGTSLMGGRATILGTLGGALIIGVLRNGLNLLNVSSYWQMVVIGSVIVVTVYLDRLKRD
jgi:ribose/xylose/arabinose/galactoside ABC-type transport system permease subunit